MRSLKLLTPPAVEPVTLLEAKRHARIELDDEDALVSSLIVAARQWAENYTGRAFVAQVWQLWLDDAPGADDETAFGVSDLCRSDCRSLVLPRGPLLSVDSVQTFDESDAATVWNASNYYVDTAREPGRLVLRSGAVWPVLLRSANGMMIQYRAGYGADASAVPEAIKTAILQLVARWYEHRGETGSGEDGIVPLTVRVALDPYRLRSLGGV